MILICRVLLLFLLLQVPLPVPGQENLKNEYWHTQAVFYNLEIAVFYDSDGDGIGDFQGLIQKLDYLETLGIDAIWLSPFQPSPGRDDGYDITDFYGINSEYGSPGDFADFIHQAQMRGLKVVMDLPLNHTSIEHPWFQKARSDQESPYRDWYIWSSTLPENWDKGMVFPGVENSTWSFDEEAREYYFHRFYSFQPDLKYANPEVRLEARKIIGYWLNQNIDGFRLDAVPFILEQHLNGHEESTEDFDILYNMRKYLQWRKGNAILLGEANVLPVENQKYFGEKSDGLHMMFNFYLNQHLFLALASEEFQVLSNALQATREIPPSAQWANFLRNHDELDLGRLSEQQRQLVFNKFGPDKNMQLYDRGIRRRLAPMLDNRNHLELAYSLMFSMPGSPVIRYGDEIGMGDDLSLEERIAVRTPMQWSNEKNAGFTSAEEPFRPIIEEGPFSFHQVNVSDQLRDENSFLNWTIQMINLRKKCGEIGLGDWEILDTGSDHVLAMKYSFNEKTTITIHNFAPETQEVSLKMEETEKLLDLITDKITVIPEDGNLRISVKPYGYHWLRTHHP